MKVVAKYISKFNNLNGRHLPKADLLGFYKEVKSQNLPGLVEVQKRLKKALSNYYDHSKIIIDKPIPLPKRKLISKEKSKARHANNSDLLYGLDNFEDDSHLDGKALDGLNDTTYKVITDRILELIKAGGLIWRKPWNDKVYGHTDLAHNYVTRSIYRGGNYYLNYLGAKYSDPYYLTFKQVTGLGGKVNKGERGWPVVYFKWLYLDTKSNKLIEKEAALDKGGKLRPGITKIPGLFYYNVFNAAQCSDLKLKPRERDSKRNQKELIESAENIVNQMPKKPLIKTGAAAFYRPSSDHVEMPSINQFKIGQEYYGTLFHELIHSTGHSSRVERDLTGSFGSKPYAFEELIAELGASYLCGESGVLYFTMKNSAAYIKGWSSRLTKEMESDPKFFLRASSQAQKAADFILNIDPTKRKVMKSAVPKARKLAKKSVVKSRQPVKLKKTVDKKTTVKKIKAGLAGFITADKTPDVPKNMFQLPGEIGALLGPQQRYKLEIVIAGETHSGKSEIAKQIADAFITLGDDVGWIDWEQGGLESRDTSDSIKRNVKPENRKKLHVSSDVQKTLEAVKAMAGHFKVIALDSGSSLKQVTNAWIDELREEYPETVWIILMQQNEKGGTRGGSAAEFDAPVVLKTYRPDETDYKKNYTKVFKNRGNKTGIYYNIASKKIISKPDGAV